MCCLRRHQHLLPVALCGFLGFSGLGGALAEASAGEALARDGAPWGYLYSFRTLMLFELTGDELQIGRLPENEIVLTSPRVSRRHAVLRRTESGLELVDVGSSNGSRLNGVPLRPRSAAAVSAGDRLQLADELLLYHDSLESLWRAELDLRLLTSFVKLRLHLPQDETRKSFGREEIVPAVTEVRIDSETAKIAVEHSVEVRDDRGFPEGSGAFVGNVLLGEETLELSLWSLAGTDSMTSRRASFSSLKHTTLRVSVAPTGAEGDSMDPASGPWFPPQLLGALFEIFPDEPDFSLRFAYALAEQERPVALHDAAESFAFRFALDQDDPEMLLRAARLKGEWVDAEIDARGIGLKAADKKRLRQALASASSWLAEAKELGADEDAEAAAGVIRQAEERLARLE